MRDGDNIPLLSNLSSCRRPRVADVSSLCLMLMKMSVGYLIYCSHSLSYHGAVILNTESLVGHMHAFAFSKVYMRVGVGEKQQPSTDAKNKNKIVGE